MGTITVDLEAAGLTHAKGKSDRCNGQHDVDMLSVVSVDDESLTWADLVGPAIQRLHEQAHCQDGKGTLSWEKCREPGCVDIEWGIGDWD